MPCTRKKIARHIPDDLLAKLRERAPRVPGGRSTDDAIAICLRRYFEIIESGNAELALYLNDSDVRHICEAVTPAVNAPHVTIDRIGVWAMTARCTPVTIRFHAGQFSYAALLALADEIERAHLAR